MAVLQALGQLFVPVGLGEEALAAPGALETIGKGARTLAQGAAGSDRRRDLIIGAVVTAGAVGGYYAFLRPRLMAGQAATTSPATSSTVSSSTVTGSTVTGGVSPTAAQLPLQPPPPEVVGTTATSVTLQLASTSGATSYTLQDAVTGATLGSGSPGNMTVTVQGLQPDTTYRFVEQAVNQYGNSSPSVPVAATTEASAALPQPPTQVPVCPAGTVAVYVPGVGWTCEAPPTVTNPTSPIAYIAGQGFDFPPPPGTYPVVNPTTGQTTGTVTVGTGGTITSTTGTGGPTVGSVATVSPTPTPAPAPSPTPSPTPTPTPTPTPAPSSGAVRLAGPSTPGAVPILNAAGRVIGYAQPGGPTTFGSNAGLSVGELNLLNAAQNPYLTPAQRAQAFTFAVRQGVVSPAVLRAYQLTSVPLTPQVMQAILAGVAVSPSTQALAQTAASQGRTSSGGGVLTLGQAAAQQRAQVAVGNAPQQNAAAPSAPVSVRPAPAQAAQAAQAAAQVQAANRAAQAAAQAQAAQQAAQAAQATAARLAQQQGGGLTLAQARSLAVSQQAAQRAAQAVQAAQAAAASRAASVQATVAAVTGQTIRTIVQPTASARPSVPVVTRTPVVRQPPARQVPQRVIRTYTVNPTTGVAALRIR